MSLFMTKHFFLVLLLLMLTGCVPSSGFLYHTGTILKKGQTNSQYYVIYGVKEFGTFSNSLDIEKSYVDADLWVYFEIGHEYTFKGLKETK